MPLIFFPLQTTGALPQSFMMFAPASQLGSAYSPISPILLQTSQNMLAQTINQGLASVNAQGSNMFATIANLFGQWSTTQNTFEQQIAQDLTTVTNKSAVACNGFFNCLL